MTAPARVTQADIERVLKSIKAAGFEQARVTIDLTARTIEVRLGKHALGPSDDEWSDLD